MTAGPIPKVSTTLPDGGWHWALGLGCAVLSSVLWIAAFQTISAAHVECNEGKIRIPKYMSVRWLFGVFFLAMAMTVQSVASALASGVFLHSLAALTMGANLVFVLLTSQRERNRMELGRWVIVKGAVLAVVGAALVAAAAKKENTAMNMEKLESHFTYVPFLVVQGVALFLVIAFFISARCHPRRYEADRTPILLFFGYAAGWAATQETLLVKAVLEVVKDRWTAQAGATSQLPDLRWQFYVMLAIAVLMVMLLVALVDTGLDNFRDGVKFVTLFQAYLVVLGTVVHLTYFQEFKDFQDWQWALFGLGLGLVTWGVVVVSISEAIRHESIAVRDRVWKRKAGKRDEKGNKPTKGMYVDVVCGISDVLCGCYQDPEASDPRNGNDRPGGERATLLR